MAKKPYTLDSTEVKAVLRRLEKGETLKFISLGQGYQFVDTKDLVNKDIVSLLRRTGWAVAIDRRLIGYTTPEREQKKRDQAENAKATLKEKRLRRWLEKLDGCPTQDAKLKMLESIIRQSQSLSDLGDPEVTLEGE